LKVTVEFNTPQEIADFFSQYRHTPIQTTIEPLPPVDVPVVERAVGLTPEWPTDTQPDDIGVVLVEAVATDQATATITRKVPTVDELKVAIDGYLKNPEGGSVKFLALLRNTFKVERVKDLSEEQRAELFREIAA
jgi:hypothetical protein